MAKSKEDDGHLTAVEGAITVNTRLYKHFPADVAEELCALPSSVTFAKGDKEKPRNQQQWTLHIVVPSETMDQLTQNAREHYAERVRNSDPTWWPARLTLNVIPASREWIAQRIPALTTEWALHHRSAADVAAEIAAQHAPTPPPTPRQVADDGLLEIFTERTESALPEVVEAVRAERDDGRTITLGDPARQKEGGHKLLFAVFNYAIGYRASDIHVEWTYDDQGLPSIQIRVRIDGVLRKIVPEAGSRGRQLLGILAVMAGANAGLNEIACHMRPQDGTIPVRSMDGRRYDCRIVFTPSKVGAQTFNAVIRLQDMSKVLRIGDLNLSPHTRSRVDYALAADEGMIVFNGPTGAGKSASLIALLLELHTDDTKIFTVENPIEFKVPGFHQTQVDARDPANSPASLLRAALRSDPDCLLVAEIRDRETAEVAVQAVDTGHLVFTTLHAKGALAVPTRLHSLLDDWHAVGNALSLVIAQRLFRRPAKDRWEMKKLDPKAVERMCGFSLAGVNADILANFQAPQLVTGFDPKDPENYAGRTGIHEAVWFDEELREAVVTGAGSRQLFDLARGKGLVTLTEDALMKVKAGDTTLEQVRGLRPI